MAEKFSIKAKIETDGGALSVLELSNFLSSFRAAYVFGLQEGGLLAATELPNEPRRLYGIAADLLRRHRGTSWLDLSRVAQTELEPWTELQLIDIERENPLKLVMAGVPLALALAVIVSGGKVDVGYGGFKAELPPLGTGIASIREAFKSGDVPPAEGVPAPGRNSGGKKPDSKSPPPKKPKR